MNDDRPELAADAALVALSALAAVRNENGDLLTHALRSATLAVRDLASPALIAATLLHDIGHTMEPEDDIDCEHAAIGAQWLERYFGPDVCEPIRLHVTAKRYRVWRDGGHALDRASTQSLAKQGGALIEAEANEFEASPYFLDALRLRRYDDGALSGPAMPLDDFRALLAEVAAASAPRRTAAEARPLVYVALSADMLHQGHVNVLDTAASLGRVVVGLLTDEAICGYKRVPLMRIEERARVVRALRQVDTLIAQPTLDYRDNLEFLRPAYVVHGDDWRVGVQARTRQQVIDTLSRWGGELVETAYTHSISSTSLQARIRPDLRDTSSRCASLSACMALKPFLRVLEAHNGLSAMIADRARVERADSICEFDALWSGSLTTAAQKGKLDVGIVDLSSRLDVLRDVLSASFKPVLFDAEEGGTEDEITEMVRLLAKDGASAIVIEDKVGVKRNSFSTGGEAQLAGLDTAAGRIAIAAARRPTRDLLVFARLENMILGGSVDDAVERALRYEAAGADVILPHSKRTDADQVLAFAQAYRQAGGALPLACVPSTYAGTGEERLQGGGFSIVIYANQLLRAAVEPMMNCALNILADGSAAQVSSVIAPIRTLVDLDSLRPVSSPEPSPASGKSGPA